MLRRVIPLIALLALLASTGQASDDSFRTLSLFKPGRPQSAPDFTLASPDGKTVQLAAYRGRVVFLNFWATWCPPCLEEMPAMERLYQRFRDRGLVVLAVSFDHDVARIKPFVERHRFTFQVAQDPKMSLASQYRLTALPVTLLIDKRGEVVALATGPRDWDTTPAYALVESLLR
jgi:peroxiredoxin